MNYIVEYIKKPIETGVHICKARIDLQLYDRLVSHIVDCCGRGEKTRIRSHLKLDHVFSIRSLLNKLSYALDELSETEKCPKTISNFYDESVSGKREKVPIYQQILREAHPIEMLEPLILTEQDDVLSIDFLSPSREELEISLFTDTEELDPLTLEISSVKDSGAEFYLKFLKSIPYVGKKVQVVKAPQKTCSSRYSFRPYPLAVRLWLLKNGKTTIPKDLQDFIDRASVYHVLKEWRTSIVLSAITVESLLADLYEESYRKQSPEKATLGELFDHVKREVDFPSYVADSIVKTNNARISAVHRSHRLAVSEREATNALFGAVNLSIWYLSDYYKQAETSSQ